MEREKFDEQLRWDKEKWAARKESVYHELFFRQAEEGERDIMAITEKDVEEMKKDIGTRTAVEVPGRVFNQEVTRDALRHLAQGDGNLNPLYYDEEYAEKTRWGGLIAPPTFLHCTGSGAPQKETGRRRTAGVTRGLQSFYSGDDCYYYRPIRPGDFLWRGASYPYSVELKKSAFSGQTLIRRNLTVFRNQRGEVVVVRINLGITGGRQTKTDEKGYGERKKYSHIKKQYYTPEDIKRIDADMDREEIRGANPRYWEDVNEGDDLTPVVKGPLLVADMITFDIGHGMTMYDGALHMAYNYRKKHPAGMPLNAYGIPDVAESAHWVERIGRKITNVGAYNYGEQSYAWLCHLCTNWMGDDAWLYHIDDQFRRFIYNGDTNWVKGKVTRKYIDDAGQYKVDLEIWSEDQRGDGVRTLVGHATVMLPSRVGGLPPVPPLDTPAPYKPEELEFSIPEEPIWRDQLVF